ncbi:MAG: hypothetical protein FJ091_05995 [Deltaproteobacteria bacterium]|nr:hypothetical protein [Deltaproteobacteria bacterium]
MTDWLAEPLRLPLLLAALAYITPFVPARISVSRAIEAQLNLGIAISNLKLGFRRARIS